MLKHNIRKVLLCLLITIIAILFVYCSRTKVEVNKEYEDNLIVFKARMCMVNDQEFKLEDIILKDIVTKTQTNSVLKAEKKVVVNKYSFTEEEIDLLERVVMGETEGEPMAGKIAVLQVVINRSEKWHKTIKEVIYQKRQFSSAHNGRFKLKPSKECKKAVKMFIKGADTSIDSSVLYFYAPDECNSKWHENKLEYVVTIGGHKFFREK